MRTLLFCGVYVLFLVAPGGEAVAAIRHEPLDFGPESPKSWKKEYEKPTVSLNVQFDRNSAALTEVGIRTLDNLAGALRDPALRNDHFEISGHTDESEGIGFSLELSLLRAGAVMKYLVRSGIPAGNLSLRGMGSTRPLVPSPDPRNSRVVITNLR
jgi:outer membrane protein OmpA-like peptidoglycan-associated protein